jgi:hypothetical protein
MRTTIERVLHWTPRFLGLLFAAFISVFALDAFGPGHTFWQVIGDLATHAIPTAVVLAVLAISWRWAWAGGVMYLSLGAWYLTTTRGRFPGATYVVIAGPLFLLGLLFEIDWWHASRAAKRI